MSSSFCVRYRGEAFWAFDVALDLLLDHVIAGAKVHLAAGRHGWLEHWVDLWGAAATGASFVMLHDEWTPAEAAVVLDLLDAAVGELDRRDEVSGDELDRRNLMRRNVGSIPAWRAADVGRAAASLLRGELPPLPPNAGTWAFGWSDPPLLWKVDTPEFRWTRARSLQDNFPDAPIPPPGGRGPFAAPGPCPFDPTDPSLLPPWRRSGFR